MTKTEAAEIVARHIRVQCLSKNDAMLTRLLIEEVLSEQSVHHSSTLLGRAAQIANWKTIVHELQEIARLMGEPQIPSWSQLPIGRSPLS